MIAGHCAQSVANTVLVLAAQFRNLMRISRNPLDGTLSVRARATCTWRLKSPTALA